MTRTVFVERLPKAELRERAKNLATNEIEVELGQKELTIYLSKIHVLDMKAVLEAEEELASGLGPEASETGQE